MAISAGTCPGCGAPIEFKAGTSMSVVCAHCKHVVMRSDRELVNLGKVADVVFNDTALAHNDHGVFQNRSFVVEGRIVMQHPAGGTWEEYYALFDGRYAGWIEEAMGVWYVMQQVTTPVPPIEQCEPGSEISLGAYGAFVVGERSEGTFLSAEGELPFGVPPGAVRRFVDLSAADGARASIHYGDGNAPPEVFIGVQTNFASLGVYQRSGERAAHDVRTQEIQCPNCGAPFPPRATNDAQRIACVYCNALSDLATHRVLAQQGAERAKPVIPLGSKGTLEGSEWVVIGFVVRRTFVEGEEFRWEEFLLYNESEGYRWLIADEGSWLLGKPINAGDVDTNRFPDAVKHKQKLYKRRNQGTAEVVLVLGEFYWKVEVGEKVLSHDFECRGAVLSREAAETEINWTLSNVTDSSRIAEAFGLDADRLAGAIPFAAAAQPAPAYGEGFDSYVGGTPLGAKSSGFVRGVVILGIAIAFLAIVSKCDSTGDDDGTASVRGGSTGGFGGK
jgi:uncharacterized protein DUF4178